MGPLLVCRWSVVIVPAQFASESSLGCRHQCLVDVGDNVFGMLDADREPHIRAFDAKGGLKSAGAGAQLKYQWNEQWSSRLYLEYEHLLGSAASSPLVTERGSVDQVTFGVGLSYSFDFHLR